MKRGLLLAIGVAVLGCGGSKAGVRDAASTDAADAARADAVGEGGTTDLPADAPGTDAPMGEGGPTDVPIDAPGTDTATEAGATDAPADVPGAETGTEAGATDTSADAFVGPVTTVGSFGCFARSGDGNDYFPDGTPAVIVTNSPWRAPCDLKWIGLEANGYTKPTVPSTESLERRFIIDSLISDRATFTVSFEADDAAEIVLNGKVIAACNPPAGNIGECQQSCHVVTLSKDDFKPVGQVNVLEMKMINLQNTSTGGGNTGYTGISYAICAMGE